MKKVFIILLTALTIACSSMAFASDDYIVDYIDDDFDDYLVDVTENVPMGEVLPEYTFTTLDGETFNTTEVLKEKDAILINFFRTTCPFCIEEFPVFAELEELYGDKAAFLALDSDTYDTEEDIREMQEYYDITTAIAQEISWTISEKIPYIGYPCTIILDKNGELVFYQDYGFSDVDELTDTFDAILAEDYKNGYQKLNSFNDLPDETLDAQTEQSQKDASGKNTVDNGYKIIVTDQNGDPVENVMINFCSEAQGTCRMNPTDARGEIFFEVPEDEYHLVILAAPEGYSYDKDFEMFTEKHYQDPIDIVITKD